MVPKFDVVDFMMFRGKNRKFLYQGLAKAPKGIASIPPRFSYSIISKEGDPMSDGLIVPGMFDGMAAFKLDHRRIVLVRNHELTIRNKYIPCFGKKREQF